MTSRRKLRDVNFLDLVPSRAIEWRDEPDGRITLLRPKFIGGLMERWVQPRLRRPHYLIHLDEIGSAIWGLVDGVRTAGEICAELELRFGDRVKPAHVRVPLFLRELDKGKMIRLSGLP